MWKKYLLISATLYLVTCTENPTIDEALSHGKLLEVSDNETVPVVPEISKELGRGKLDKKSQPRKGVDDDSEVSLNVDELLQAVNDQDTGKNVSMKTNSKPRKGVELQNVSFSVTTITPFTKSKPTASATSHFEEEIGQPNNQLLTVGLSLGILIVLIIASVSYWRLRDVWARRQYKRVDFLIDGMYVDA